MFDMVDVRVRAMGEKAGGWVRRREMRRARTAQMEVSVRLGMRACVRARVVVLVRKIRGACVDEDGWVF